MYHNSILGSRITSYLGGTYISTATENGSCTGHWWVGCDCRADPVAHTHTHTHFYEVTGWALDLLKVSARGGWAADPSSDRQLQQRADTVILEGYYIDRKFRREGAHPPTFESATFTPS